MYVFRVSQPSTTIEENIIVRMKFNLLTSKVMPKLALLIKAFNYITLLIGQSFMGFYSKGHAII